MRNSHFLLHKPDKPIFQKNPDVLFFCLYSCWEHIARRQYDIQNMFNGPYNAIFWDSVDGRCGEDHYLLGFVFPYLENLHSFGYYVPTFVEHNPFGKIRCND